MDDMKDEISDIYDIEELKKNSRINVHQFCESFDDVNIFYHVMKMNECFFIWIGKSGKFNDLSMSMPNNVNILIFICI